MDAMLLASGGRQQVLDESCMLYVYFPGSTATAPPSCVNVKQSRQRVADNDNVNVNDTRSTAEAMSRDIIRVKQGQLVSGRHVIRSFATTKYRFRKSKR